MRQLLFLPLLCYVGAARAQSAAPALFNTYTYTAYTVHDTISGEPPTQVCGVSGSLTLRPTGSYKKRLSIVGPQGPVHYKQNGTFRVSGDSILFTVSNNKPADVQRGTFRFDPATRRLNIVTRGLPNGTRGVYELVAAKPASLPETLDSQRR